jgi:hypothetical protein
MKPTQAGGCLGRPSDKDEQDGGCGEQFGGAFSAEANTKRDAWLAEVRAVRDELDVSWKEAMVQAKRRRMIAASKEGREYVPMSERSADRLATLRIGREQWEKEVAAAHADLKAVNPKATRRAAILEAAKRRKAAGFSRAALRAQLQAQPGWKAPEGRGPYGSKNKRPVTLDVAKQILLQYYRDRAANFKKGPLGAMKRDISSCKDDDHTLIPCTNYTKTQVGTTASGKPKFQINWFPTECRDSWKYRPGTSAKGRTGPGVYDVEGLDNLCKKKGRQALLKDSELYNLAKMRKAPVSEEARAKRSAAMKAKWAAMSPEKREAIKAKRAATMAAKKRLLKQKPE